MATTNAYNADCTELEVELSNKNYENSTVVNYDGPTRRGYKLATLRGLTGDVGVIEDIKLGTIKDNDLELSRDIILSSPMLKPSDILINDRGFLSRDIINELKTKRDVDTYIPLRKNMLAYQDVVSIAKMQKSWKKHPNKKRKNQKIAFVEDVGNMWQSEHSEDDIPLNGCVVWDTKDDEYYVFVTTDTTKTPNKLFKLMNCVLR